MVSTCPDCQHGLQPDGSGSYECEYCGYVSEPMPDAETMTDWMNDGGCETPCGCWVEPDGKCQHGNFSWMILQGLL